MDATTNKSIKLVIKQKLNIQVAEKTKCLIVHAPSLQHSVQILMYKTQQASDSDVSDASYHKKIVDNIEKLPDPDWIPDQNNNDEQPATYYKISSEYEATKCVSSILTITNIGSTNSDGIIIEEVEFNRSSVELINDFNYTFTTDENELSDDTKYYVLTKKHMRQIIDSDWTYSPDYDVSLLNVDTQKVSVLTADPTFPFNRIPPSDANLHERDLQQAFYCNNINNKAYNLTLNSQNGVVVFVQTTFLLVPKLSSSKNLFSKINI